MGRERDNDLVVEDRAVSRIHAEVIQRTDGYYLVDRSRKTGAARVWAASDMRLYVDSAAYPSYLLFVDLPVTHK